MTEQTEGFRLALTKRFTRDQSRLSADRQLLSDLSLTLGEIALQPFGNPRLQTHAVRGAQPGVFTSYVGRHQHRVIWFQAGATAMLLLFDRHDEAYRRAVRLRVEPDTEEGFRVVELRADASESDVLASPPSGASVGLFDPWEDALLQRVGLALHEINQLREVSSDDQLFELERYMAPSAFELAVQVAAAKSVADLEALWPVSSPAAEEPEVEVLGQVVEARVSDGTSPEARLIDADHLDQILAQPIEDWMVFLHPDQRDLAERSFNGPARVTGGAGTGKTVVGLHRAARLAGSGRRVLFTTYIRTLPPVLSALYDRMGVPGEVQFTGIHAFAREYLGQSAPPTDVSQIDAAFDDAWRKVASHGSSLREIGLPKQYFRDEIAWVIKGRGLSTDDREQYLAAPRTGRGTALGSDARGAVWDLYLRYEQRLEARGTRDFEDLLRQARDHARHTQPSFDSVIVDEAQDLSRVGLEFVHSIVGDETDGLLLLGDGQQSLYPGGHSLGAVGIDVRGRAAVLRVNYRNTAEIVRVADRIVAGRPFDDGDNELAADDPATRFASPRGGEAPRLVGFDTEDDHDEALLLVVEQWATSDQSAVGDVAVLVPTNSLVRTYIARIADLGLPTLSLADYDGTTQAAVKVGTFKRAKGLEFKHVAIPRCESKQLRDHRLRGEDDATYEERVDRMRRELYVAVTRARDSVWIGHVGPASHLLGTEGTS